MQNEYACNCETIWCAGTNNRVRSRVIKKAVIYTIDPGEIAYNKTRSLAYSYKEQHDDDRSKYYYMYRKAIRKGDELSARNALEKLKEAGVKRKGLKRSLEQGDPFSMLSRKERRELMKTMSASEREDLKQASKWWREQRKRN